MADQKITDLTELLAPAAADLLPIVDASEAAAASKNKRIQYSTLLNRLPAGTVGAPALAWSDDAGATGIYRTDANELAFVNNDSNYNGKFTTTGFQLGVGTAAAQLHLFSSDTSDQVIIENTDAGLDTAPDLVLYRNSASPAASDNLGTLIYRGEDSAGNTHDYAEIASVINSPTDGAEIGILDLKTANNGAPASRLRISGASVGINETNPAHSLHVGATLTGTALNVKAVVDDPASAADLTLLHIRGASTAGQDADVVSSVFFRGHNDAPTEVDYAAIEASIVDASDTTEDGALKFQVQTAGTLTTQLEVQPAVTFLGSGVATDAAVINTLNFRGANDNATPEDINYAAIEASVVDNADGAEDGRITIQTMSGGTLATRLDIDENKIGFFGATAAAQVAAITDITTTATTGALPTASDTNTIADAAAPTVDELLQYCVTLEAKVEALIDAMQAHGLMAT